MHRRLIMILATILALVLAAPVYAGPPDHAKGPNKDKKPKQSQPIEANDEYYELQWGPKQINAEEAWATATGAGQVISIVDTGIDLDHPDLAGKIVGGATFTGCADSGPCGNGDWESGPPEAQEEGHHPHGTHVAGSAAAITGNGIGIAGVAPEADMLAVKVLTNEGGSFEEIAAGIRWSVDNGADVINMSLGALPGVQALTITGLISETREAVDYAVS